MRSLDSPLLDSLNPEDAVPEGSYVRYYGVLESLEGSRTIWVRGQRGSVRVQLSGDWVYSIPAGQKVFSAPPGKKILRFRWSKAGILTEGLGVFVYARKGQEKGLPTLYVDNNEPMLLLLYEAAETQITSKALWFGRIKNEFWNSFTPLSLVAGTGLLLALALIAFIRQGNLSEGLWAMTFALIPYLALMPPGVLGYFIYRRLWKQALFLSAKLDLYVLACRMKGSPVLLKNCAYTEIQILPGLKEYASEPSQIFVRLQDSKRESKTPCQEIRSLFYPRLQRDPAAETLLFEGLSLQKFSALRKKTAFKRLLSIAVFLLGLGINFWTVINLLIQLILSL